MSNKKSRDPYRILGTVCLCLLLLAAAFYAGNYFIEKNQRSQHESLQKKIDEENAKLKEEYNQKLAEQQEKIAQREQTLATTPAPQQSGWDVVDMSGYPVNGSQVVTASRQEALTGGLLLVNRWHELPADFATVEGYIKSVGTETKFKVPVTSRSVSLFPNAISAVQKMVEDAKKEGLEYFILRQGYRSMKTQMEAWQKVADKHKDKTGDTLTEAVRKTVSYPGTSDYQTGLSFEVDLYSKEDPVVNNTDFQKSEQAKFLNENGWKYGIIFRFPAAGYPYAETVDKDHVTGVRNKSLKMNAYRYVGVAHATVMHIKGFALEEYIDFLRQHPHIMVYEDGVLKYEIFRQNEMEVSQNVTLPDNAVSYSVSSDNLGGLIVAVNFQ